MSRLLLSFCHSVLPFVRPPPLFSVLSSCPSFRQASCHPSLLFVFPSVILSFFPSVLLSSFPSFCLSSCHPVLLSVNPPVILPLFCLSSCHPVLPYVSPFCHPVLFCLSSCHSVLISVSPPLILRFFVCPPLAVILSFFPSVLLSSCSSSRQSSCHPVHLLYRPAIFPFLSFLLPSCPLFVSPPPFFTVVLSSCLSFRLSSYPPLFFTSVLLSFCPSFH